MTDGVQQAPAPTRSSSAPLPARLTRWRGRAQALVRAGRERPLVTNGNRVELLVNGDGYFPQLLAAIESARDSIHLETYIFADDVIGLRVADALVTAAARGVQVHLLVDGYGGGEHARRLVGELGPHGVRMRIFRPERWWRLERKLLRRLHRKLVVVDDRIAFLGGINIVSDYTEVPVAEGGRRAARYDFAVRCEGPIVAAIALAARRLWWTLDLVQPGRRPGPRPVSTMQQPRFDDGVRAALLLRDNLRNRSTIERAYLRAIEDAREEVMLANAYFLPGRRFRAALRDAVARGVRVRLLLQGQVEYALQHYAQRALYGSLLAAGIEIHEYRPSYLHAKVAVIDRRWATVGSSNIDPYSLLLAREANVVVLDATFAEQLRAELVRSIEHDAEQIRVQDDAQRGLLGRAADWLAYSVVRLATVVLARSPNY
ncbi:MAG: cardiolipin synthase ClsB [Burkholderiales bacterium]|nr:cardiolipin synthase ClsB [Burkholderiales bacterium]